MTDDSARTGLFAGRRGAIVGIGSLIVTVTVVRLVISLRGYFLEDDFAILYRAARQPWSVAYAFEPYNDHISPIGYSLQWILQAWFPGSHVAVVLFTGFLWAATLVLLAGLIWECTGRPRAVVLSTVVAGLGMFTFEIGTWWCTTVYSMTYLAAVSGALWALARTLRRGAPWSLVLVAFAVAALCDSKGFLSLVLLFAFASGVALRPDGAPGALGAWRMLRPLWVSSSIVASAILLLTLIKTSGLQGEPNLSRGAGMLWELWVLNIGPAVLGGPWWWSELPNGGWPAVRVVPSPPMAVGVICLLACAGGLLAVLRRRPEIARFVPWALFYAAITTAIPVLGRSGSTLATPAFRYTFDLVLPVTILLCLSLVPLWWQPDRGRLRSWLVAGGLAVSMVISTAVPAAAWGQNESRNYMARATSGFQSIPEGQPVIRQGVPEGLVRALMWQYANTEAVMTPHPGSPSFSDTATGFLYGFAADGSVEVQEVVGPRSPEGPDQGCGYAVTTTPRIVPLEGSLIRWKFMARVAYFSQTDTTLNVAFGGRIQSVELPASELAAIYFEVSGPGDEVALSISSSDATVCVTDVRIGNRVSPSTGEVVPFEPESIG